MEIHNTDPPPIQPPLPGELSPAPRPSFQFGIRSIFVLTAAVAVFVTIMFVLSDEIAGPLILGLFPVVLAGMVAVVWLSRGWPRMFCAGAVVPAGLLAIGIGLYLGIMLMQVEQRRQYPAGIGGTPPTFDSAYWFEGIKLAAPAYRFWFGWTSAASVLSGLVFVVIWACLPERRPNE